MKKNTSKTLYRITVFITALACLMACFLPFNGMFVSASDDEGASFLSSYCQTVYNQENGLDSTEVNCIYQTRSGYIWIGTDGGLYRYNGKEFMSYNLWETEKDDIYFINDLYQDDSGRLWVSTNNYGLFFIEGSNITHFDNDYYSGVKCVNDVTCGSDGNIYVATAYGVYIANPDTATLKRVESLASHNIKELAVYDNKVWGIYNGNTIFTIDEEENLNEVASSVFTSEELSCISSDEDNVYIGTTGSTILAMKNLKKADQYNGERDGINSIYPDGEGKIFVLADNGIGYFDRKFKFTKISGTNIETYLSSMMKDYEGNLWFTSNRYGILLLGNSKFTDLSIKYNIPAYPTNCILNIKGNKYIGTDEGLQILNITNQSVTNELTDYLKGTAIKNLFMDSKGNIWISTSRRHGIVEYSKDGKITSYGRSAGLPTNLINCAMELSDGNIAIGTEEGLCIISPEGKSVKNYAYQEGVVYSNITALYEDKEKRIFAGSDGGGLYIIDGNKVSNYTDKDGLTSNVITCFKEGEQGVYIGTDNGLSLYNDSIRAISNIDFSNNIYDILIDKVDDTENFYIIGSKGVLKTTESRLISAEALQERYLSQSDGLRKKITINSKSIVDESHKIYICTNDGIVMLDNSDLRINNTSPRLTISEVDIDDKIYYFDQIGGSIKIPAKTQRVAISFSVLSYTNRDNIKATYKLDGFDSQETTIKGTDTFQAVYTNLDGGNYTFTVTAKNGDGIESEKTITFEIYKEYGFFEKRIVKFIGIIILIGLMIVATVAIIRFQRRYAGQNQEIEKLSKEHEDAVKSNTAKTDFLANMSNEIKIPVNAIITLAENLRKNHRHDSDEDEEIQNIITTSQNILYRVDETIQLARLEAGRVKPNNAPYSITTLVCDISDNIINQLEGRPVRFLVDLGDQIPDILVGDFEKIKNLLQIVMDNASKYTKEGTITLSVDCYEIKDKNEVVQNLVFSISDTGIGIQADQIDTIFEAYAIGENKKKKGGGNINLAIAKKLCEVMNGQIEVDSTYGAGSTFTISLIQYKPEEEVVTGSVDINSIERISKEEASKMITPDINALIVDDDELSRSVAVGVLKQMEMKVDTSGSGINAIDMVMNNEYDVIFMDAEMPVMNGLDALREIREIVKDNARTVPVIAMSVDAIGETTEELKRNGFNEVIVKPLDIVSLATVIVKTIPSSMIKYKSNDIVQYMSESRYSEGLNILQQYIDVVGTLEKIGGNIDVYNKILDTYYNQNLTITDELKEKFTENYRAFRNRIHNIRTSAQNIGALDLYKEITMINAAINIGNRSYVRDNLDKLCKNLEDIQDIVGDYLDFVDSKQGTSDEEYASRAVSDRTEILTSSDKKEISEVRGREEKEPDEVNAADEVKIRDEKPLGTVSLDKLTNIQLAVDGKDYDKVREIVDDIASQKYQGDDNEFVEVLLKSVNDEDYDTTKELIITYIELKQ